MPDRFLAYKISSYLFQNQLNAIDNGVWSTITEGILGKYCQNRDRALILANQQNDKYVVTKDLALETDDVIQFRVSVWNFVLKVNQNYSIAIVCNQQLKSKK